MHSMLLMVAAQALPADLVGPAVVVGALVLILASVALLFVSRYRRCPANKVLVIQGKVEQGKAARVMSGGGAFVWPVIQEYAYLDLQPHQIEIPLTDALSLENIRVRVPSWITVAIGDTEEHMQNAAMRLLHLSEAEVKDLAANIIFGQMRQVIASMGIEDINRNREHFTGNIVDALEPELRKVGLKLINVNIVDISDESSYIKSIGEKAAAQAVQKARGDVAEEEKQGEIRVADAHRARDVAVAEANREREIGVKTAERDQAMRLADLQREREVAEERAVYQRDTEVAQADQERRIAVADADATAVEGETLSRAKVAAANAELAVKEAEAFQKGETQRRVSKAAVEEAEARAQAKAALAEAERIEAERRAALEAPAKAEKAKRIVEAEAQAESRRLEAEGDAAAIFAMREAEARGEYEMLSKKAEGLRRIVEAAGGADEAYRLLILEHIDYMADRAAEAIANIKFDKVVMWGGAGGNGSGAGAGVSHFVKDLMGTLPPALQTMMEIGGVKLPDGIIELLPDADAEEAPKEPALGRRQANRKAMEAVEAPVETPETPARDETAGEGAEAAEPEASKVKQGGDGKP
jgi:flotillin